MVREYWSIYGKWFTGLAFRQLLRNCIPPNSSIKTSVNLFLAVLDLFPLHFQAKVLAVFFLYPVYSTSLSFENKGGWGEKG